MERKKSSDFTSEDPGIEPKKRKSSDKKPKVRDLSENKSDQPPEKTKIQTHREKTNINKYIELVT